MANACIWHFHLEYSWSFGKMYFQFGIFCCQVVYFCPFWHVVTIFKLHSTSTIANACSCFQDVERLAHYKPVLEDIPEEDSEAQAVSKHPPDQCDQIG
jgi:hypothetical protein